MKQGGSRGKAVSKYEKGTRSYIMSRIRGRDTSIETMTRSYLFRHGFRFRKNDRRYPGHPDIVLPKYRTVVFVNGCFWHGHEGCRYARIPKSNVEFWTAKLARNRERDLRQHRELEAMGWHVIVVWECELRRGEDGQARLARLAEQIRGCADGDGRRETGGGHEDFRESGDQAMPADGKPVA